MVNEQKQMRKPYENYLNKKYRIFRLKEVLFKRKLIRRFIIVKRFIIRICFFIKRHGLVIS